MAVSAGTVRRVNGPVVEVEGLAAAMQELIEVGHDGLPGEVIGIVNNIATVQVYEYTGGLRPGDPARTTGLPLVAQLGPGLIGNAFDGMLRRLSGVGDRLSAGVFASPSASWRFTPAVQVGDTVAPGTVLGTVPESAAIEFRALVPDSVSGQVEWLSGPGDVESRATIARVSGRDIPLTQAWPVRRPRPAASRLPADAPLATGQRVLDLFYPIAHGSSAAVPGGFGTGKTVLLQQIAKWCDADVIVYVGCGERGNEMADVLDELSALTDPRTGQSLLDRTVLVANTSNMPVLAREASIYTGATVAEFFRDMGYDVVLVADSTSRWAEALREVGSRTRELPAEEGYPAGLASALAAFYERAGRFRTLAGGDASITILGAVSPPGGDMTEPVSAHTRRFVRCVWSLDPDLAYARHYPAVSWRDSFTRDADVAAAWHREHGNPAWAERRDLALRVLADAGNLESMAELIGETSLPDGQRLMLRTARMLREGVLQQSSLNPNDTYSAPSKQDALLELVLGIHDRCLQLLAAGVPFRSLEEIDLSAVTRAKDVAGPDDPAAVRAVGDRMGELLEGLG